MHSATATEVEQVSHAARAANLVFFGFLCCCGCSSSSATIIILQRRTTRIMRRLCSQVSFDVCRNDVSCVAENIVKQHTYNQNKTRDVNTYRRQAAF